LFLDDGNLVNVLQGQFTHFLLPRLRGTFRHPRGLLEEVRGRWTLHYVGECPVKMVAVCHQY
jgi:hypothetical protein